jgi:short-subunit dehydrogenase
LTGTAMAPHTGGGPLVDAVRGKRIMITGASRGIGREAAVRLGEAEATLLLVARREDALREVALEVERLGGRAHVYASDLSKPEQVDQLVAAVHDSCGGVDVLVNNAGRSIRRPVHRAYTRMKDYEGLMQLNYFGALRLILAFLPGMRERGDGHLVNVSSMGTQNFTPPFSAYNAAKSALDSWSRTVSAELVGEGVSISTVYMPLVETAMTAGTSAYAGRGLMTAPEGADLIVRAIRSRRARVGPRLGIFGEVAGALSPRMHASMTGLFYQRLPAYEAMLVRLVRGVSPPAR